MVINQQIFTDYVIGTSGNYKNDSSTFIFSFNLSKKFKKNSKENSIYCNQNWTLFWI